MLWSLLVLHGHSTWEPESIVCDEQGDLVYPVSPHRILCWPQSTQEKLRRGFGKKWWPDREVEISSKKKSLAAGEAYAWLHGWPTPDFKGRLYKNQRIWTMSPSGTLQGTSLIWLPVCTRSRRALGSCWYPQMKHSGQLLGTLPPKETTTTNKQTNKNHSILWKFEQVSMLADFHNQQTNKPNTGLNHRLCL